MVIGMYAVQMISAGCVWLKLANPDYVFVICILKDVPHISQAPVLMMRPRAWNMVEHNMMVQNQLLKILSVFFFFCFYCAIVALTCGINSVCQFLYSRWHLKACCQCCHVRFRSVFFLGCLDRCIVLVIVMTET